MAKRRPGGGHYSCPDRLGLDVANSLIAKIKRYFSANRTDDWCQHLEPSGTRSAGTTFSQRATSACRNTLRERFRRLEAAPLQGLEITSLPNPFDALFWRPRYVTVEQRRTSAVQVVVSTATEM